MRLLFDEGVPVQLREHLEPHQVKTVQEQKWKALKNGDLLIAAQGEFDVLITTDTNIKYQQHLKEYSIALIVLRAWKNTFEHYLPLVGDVLKKLEDIQPGEADYIYVDEKLRQRDEQKGKQ